jgi:hypothetical protein
MILSTLSRLGCSFGVLLLVLLTNTAFQSSDWSAHAQSSEVESTSTIKQDEESSNDGDFNSLTQLVLSGMVLSFGYGVLKQFQPPRQ